ncbi:MAG: DUF2157 domain-containing protein [Pseudomonadota bacterium]
MSINRSDLEAAAAAGILQHEQIGALSDFLAQRAMREGRAKFSGAHILYYLGGMLAIGAATLFTTLAVEALGMGVLLLLSLLYFGVAVGAAIWFERRGHGILTGIFGTLAIGLTPLAVFALQHVLGLWPDGIHAAHYQDFHAWIDWRWLLMELATLAAGAVLLWRLRMPFMLMPVAVTLWYMGMDIVPALILHGGVESDFFSGAAWELRKHITLCYGAAMLALAFWVDLRSRGEKDFAFWLYLFGMLTFWGQLSSMGDGGLTGKLIYIAINFGFVLVGAILGRRVFAVFGGIGIAMDLGSLSWGLFKDSFAFVLVLTLLGFALIGAGLWWSKHERAIAAALRAHLPESLQGMLAARTI